MKVEYRASFVRDLRRVGNTSIKDRVKGIIDHLEASSTITNIPGATSLKAKRGHYRIRIGDYRLGLVVEGERVVLVRFLHRREIYRSFP